MEGEECEEPLLISIYAQTELTLAERNDVRVVKKTRQLLVFKLCHPKFRLGNKKEKKKKLNILKPVINLSSFTFLPGGF